MSASFATYGGVILLDRLVRAQALWDKATRPQRRLLADACAPIVAKLKDQPEDGYRLGHMPCIDAGPQTLRSMRAKGLIDGDRYVTVQALDAALCMDFMERT